MAADVESVSAVPGATGFLAGSGDGASISWGLRRHLKHTEEMQHECVPALKGVFSAAGLLGAEGGVLEGWGLKVEVVVSLDGTPEGEFSTGDCVLRLDESSCPLLSEGEESLWCFTSSSRSFGLSLEG